MNNIITKILGIKEADIRIKTVRETKSTMTIEVEKTPNEHYCEPCGCRMYSKGIYRRKVNHPIMQNGRKMILQVNQRRWQCSNPA